MKVGLAPWLGLLLASGACGDSHQGPSEELRVGAKAPAFWSRTDSAALTVGWLLRPEHLVVCETAARQLRHVRARFGAGVNVSVASTATDSGAVRAYLRRERLTDVPLIAIPEPEFSSRFGPVTQPALFVIRGNAIVKHRAADRQNLLDSIGVDWIEHTLDSLQVTAALPEADFQS